MKKGINIWSFPEGTLEESFALAKDAGITLMSTSKRMYEACGILYTAGLGKGVTV